MALADCIVQVTVSKQDQETLQNKVSDLVRRGVPQEQAERQAAQELLDSYLSVLEGVRNDLNQQGFDVEKQEINRAIPEELFQDSGKKRGSFTINNQGNVIIKLFESSDRSTFLHETGHFFLEVFGELAESKDANEQIKNDWKSVLDWLGVKSKNEIEAKHHEQWARGFESYLFEGNAPSIELETAFDRFRSWLVKVYRNIKALNVRLNDDVRGVMDRMLATEKEIEAARGRAIFRPDQKILELLTAAEQEDYIKRGERAAREARQKLMKKLMREVEREKREWWKKERAGVQNEVEKEVKARPLYSLILEAKENKIDRKSVENEIGEEGRKRLPIGITESKGVHPQVYVERFGYTSTTEMYEALFNAENINVVIERETDQEMKRRHGDILNDGTIEEEAMISAHNDSQGDSIAIELRTINRQIGAPAILRTDAKEAARRLISNKIASQATKPSKYLNASIRYAKESGKFLARKDYENAGEAKRKQLLNYYLYRESITAREDVVKLERLARRFKNDNTRKSIDKQYRDQIDGILQRFELLKSEKLQQPQENFGSFVAGKDAEGEFIFQPEIMSQPVSKPYLQLTMGELRDVRNTIRSLQKNGREEKSIEVEGQKLSAREAALKAANSIAENVKKKTRKSATESEFDKKRRGLGELNAAFLRPEFLMKELDGGRVNGPVAQVLLNPIAKAQKDSYILQKKLFDQLGEILQRNPNTRSRWNQKIFDSEFGLSFSLKSILSMALNMGNNENLEKMKRGGITADNGDRIQFTDADLARLTQHLTKEDWRTVQDIWDMFEEIRPDLQKVYSQLTGVDMKIVQAQPVQTKFGTFAGGYFPLVYDQQQAGTPEEFRSLDLVGKDFEIPSVNRGMGKTRTKFAAPILLDFDSAVRTHIQKTAHLITHGTVVRDINRVMTNQEFVAEVTSRAGRAVYDNLRSWLVAVARNTVYDDPVGITGKVVRHLRQGVTQLYLGLSLATFFKQSLGITVLEAAVTRGEISQKNLLKGYRSYLQSPGKISEFVFENSNEMITRVKNLNSEVATTATRTPATTNLEKFRNMGVGIHGYSQIYSVDIPAWISAYYHSMEESDNHKKAVDFADAIVRQTQGGGNVKDLAAVQRGPEGQRLLFTMFGTYSLGVLFPKIQELTKDAFKRGKLSRAAVTLVPLLFLPAVLEGLMSGQEPDDEDEWVEWAALRTMVYGLNGIPIIGNPIASAIEGFKPSLGPLQSIMDGIVRGFNSKKTETQVKSAVLAIGLLLKVPIYKPYQTIEEIHQVSTGRDEFSVREVFLGAPDDERR